MFKLFRCLFGHKYVDITWIDPVVGKVSYPICSRCNKPKPVGIN